MTEPAEQTTPWEAGGVTKDRFVTEGAESEGIFSLGDVNIFPAAGPGPVAIAAGAEIAAQIVKAVNNHDALVKALEQIRDSRWNENADMDAICNTADQALRALVGGRRT